MSWAQEVGGSFGLTLTTPEFRLSALRAVGLQDTQPTSERCSGSNCGKELTPVHKRLCIKRHLHTYRHNLMLDKLFYVLKRAGFGALSREDGSPFVQAAASNRLLPVGIADILVRAFPDAATGDAGFAGRNIVIDGSMVDPAATVGAERTEGHAAAKAEEKKVLKYAGTLAAGCVFVPFIVET
jgi:hypothetical protein